MRTVPRNPYIAGKALNDARGFFGHGDVFRLVETVLSSPDQNSVVLFGQRRTTARQRVSRVVHARRSPKLKEIAGKVPKGAVNLTVEFVKSLIKK